MNTARKVNAWAARNGFTAEDTGDGTETLYRTVDTIDVYVVPQHGRRFRNLRQAAALGIRRGDGSALSFKAGPLGKLEFVT